MDLCDSIAWTLSLGCSVGIALYSGSVLSILLSCALGLVAWMLLFFCVKKTFRKNASPGFVSGFIAVPSALVARGSPNANLALLIALTLSILYLVSVRLVPTEDLLYSIVFQVVGVVVACVMFRYKWLQAIASFVMVYAVHTVLMKYAPNSFTIGEFVIVSMLSMLPVSCLFTANGVEFVEMALVAIGIITLVVSLATKVKAAALLGALALVPVLLNLKELLEFVFTAKRLGLLAFCGVVCGSMVLISAKWLSSTHLPQIIQRKYFHIMAIIIFVPTMLIDTAWLKLALSGAIFVFLVIESVRIVRFPYLASFIDGYIEEFVDERDSGELVLTHIFLLLGCGIPVFLCNGSGVDGVTLKSSGIAMLAIGDTMASVVGVNFGRTKWPGTKKSVEGTLGAFVGTWICSALTLLCSMSHARLMDYLLLAIPSLFGALDEAFTSQIDNLTLPLINIPVVTLAMQLSKQLTSSA